MQERQHPLIEFSHISKIYEMGDSQIRAVNDVSFQIQKGEFVAIVGQSGSGKSTCMNIIGCLDVPTSGTYLLDGRDVGQMDKDQLAAIRNKMLGFIFQQYNLLPRLNLLENVEVPLVYANISRAERHKLAKDVLEKVGLGDKLKNLPNQLSGGQQQRVSIGRALMNAPAIVLADEPTGNLDSRNSQEIMELLKLSNKKYSQTLVMITHDEKIALSADRIIEIRDGKLVKDCRNGGENDEYSK